MEIIVFLPGIMGSHLEVAPDDEEHPGQPVWPPTTWEIIRDNYRRYDLFIKPNLIAPQIVGDIWPCDVYAGLLADLRYIAHARTVDAKLEDARVVPFPYDFRLDLRDLADKLGNLLSDQLAQDPDAKIAIVAHSMGGLIARYALEAPEFDGADWRKPERLNRLITLATPHYGAPLALDRALGLSGTLGIQPAQFKSYSALSDYPSSYQLMPGPGAQYVRDETHGLDAATTLDPFNPGFINRFGLSAANMRANKKFREGLDLDRRPCDYLFFAGGGKETGTGIRVIGDTAFIVADTDSGDETVPAHSAGSSRVPTRYFSASHVGLLQNLRMRRVLFKLLGAPRDVRPVSSTGDAAGESPIEDIDLPIDAVTAGAEFKMSVNLPAPAAEFSDRLRFEPVQNEDPDGDEIDPRREEIEIRYDGPPLESLSFVVRAPERIGVYAVSFVERAADNPVQPRIIVKRSN